MPKPTWRTSDNVARVISLRQRGLTMDEIASKLGISRQTVSRAVRVGASSYDAIEANRDMLLDRHGVIDARGDFVLNMWTRERVIAAIRAWARRYGSPPKCKQWDKPNGAGKFLASGQLGARPSVKSVVKLFGSWNAAIEAAGFEARPRHAAKGFVDVKKRARRRCKHGHLFTPDNVYREPGQSARHCRTCMRRASREYMRRSRAKAKAAA